MVLVLGLRFADFEVLLPSCSGICKQSVNRLITVVTQVVVAMQWAGRKDPEKWNFAKAGNGGLGQWHETYLPFPSQ